MMEQLRGAVDRLAQRARITIGRGKITQSDDSKPVQILQVNLSPLELADILRIGEFGLASWPPDNCGAVCVFINGERSNGAVIGTHDLPSRFKLGNKGESALFDANGAAGVAGKWIWLKKGTGIEIEANGEPVVIKDALSVTISPKAGGQCAVSITTGGGDCTLDMGGGNMLVKNPGSVVLSDQNGEKAVVRDGDPVSAGVVHASQTAVKA